MPREKTDSIFNMYEFISSLKNTFSLSKAVYYQLSTQPIFEDESNEDMVVRDINDTVPGQFDLVYADFPLRGDKVEFNIDGRQIRINKHWEYIINIIEKLHNTGLAVFVMEPGGFYRSIGFSFEEELNRKGFYVSAVFNAPEGILNHHTFIKPILLVLSKKSTDAVFAAELLNQQQGNQVIQNYANHTYGNDLVQGIEMIPHGFKGFDRLKAKIQLEKLETQYKEFDQYSIDELSEEMNLVSSGNQHSERANSVYIPMGGSSQVVADLPATVIKHHNYIQVVLNEKANNKYVVALFRSTLGKLILSSLSFGAFFPRINRRELKQGMIPLPDIAIQNEIVSMHRKLQSLQQAIEQYKDKLALNPIFPEDMANQVDEMLHVINELSDVDRIRSYIRSGESKTIEFKESLSYDLKELKKEKYLEKAVLKTIAGFLNTDGGSLLVGVHDGGSIIGIDAEIKAGFKSKDKYLLHLKNLIKDHIGEQFYPMIDYKTVHVDHATVLLINCRASDQPCYMEQVEFYVRTNPATDKLEGQKLVEYVRRRFPHA